MTRTLSILTIYSIGARLNAYASLPLAVQLLQVPTSQTHHALPWNLGTAPSRTVAQREQRAFHVSALNPSDPSDKVSNTSSTCNATQLPVSKHHPIWNPPNILSLGRAASGPYIAYLILQENWELGIPLLIISGATDWLDGFLARRMNITSKLGSYLDPLGDKVLVGCVAGALTYKGLIPVWVAGVVVGRDVALVGGLLLHRARSFGWRWPGGRQFLGLDALTAPVSKGSESKEADSGLSAAVDGTHSATAAAFGTAATATGRSSSQLHLSATAATHDTAADATATGHSHTESQLSATAATPGTAADTTATGHPSTTAYAHGAADKQLPAMQPLMISKINTCVQFGLLGTCLSTAQYAWPGPEAVWVLGMAATATTAWSGVAYLLKYKSGKLLPSVKNT